MKEAIRNGSFERDIPVCNARDYMTTKLNLDFLKNEKKNIIFHQAQEYIIYSLWDSITYYVCLFVLLRALQNVVGLVMNVGYAK